MFISDQEIEDALEYLRSNAEAAAAARAHRLYLEEYSKSLIAMIGSQYLDLRVNAQQREALKDPKYLAHLETLRIAIYEDEKHRFRLKAVETTVNAWQTMNKVELAMKI